MIMLFFFWGAFWLFNYSLIQEKSNNTPKKSIMTNLPYEKIKIPLIQR